MLSFLTLPLFCKYLFREKMSKFKGAFASFWGVWTGHLCSENWSLQLSQWCLPNHTKQGWAWMSMISGPPGLGKSTSAQLLSRLPYWGPSHHDDYVGEQMMWSNHISDCFVCSMADCILGCAIGCFAGVIFIAKFTSSTIQSMPQAGQGLYLTKSLIH